MTTVSQDAHQVLDDLHQFVTDLGVLGKDALASIANFVAGKHAEIDGTAEDSAQGAAPVVLTEGDAAADLAGEPRSDSPSADATAAQQAAAPAADAAPASSDPAPEAA